MDLRESPIVLIDQIWMGGYLVGPVTFAVCESCSKDDVRGLLGLNISDFFFGYYRYTSQGITTTAQKEAASSNRYSSLDTYFQCLGTTRFGNRCCEFISPNNLRSSDQLQCDETIRISELPPQETKSITVKIFHAVV